jgi:hypothetical protein
MNYERFMSKVKKQILAGCGKPVLITKIWSIFKNQWMDKNYRS